MLIPADEAMKVEESKQSAEGNVSVTPCSATFLRVVEDTVASSVVKNVPHMREVHSHTKALCCDHDLHCSIVPILGGPPTFLSVV